MENNNAIIGKTLSPNDKNSMELMKKIVDVNKLKKCIIIFDFSKNDVIANCEFVLDSDIIGEL